MKHIPDFFKKRDDVPPPPPHAPPQEVTLDAIKSLSDEAYKKAHQEAKDLFELSLRIDQKIADGVRQVDTRWKWYIVAFFALVALAGYFGVPQWIRESVSSQFVGEEVQKELGQYSDEKVAAMIRTSIAETEERVKGELERTKKELSDLQATIVSARQETGALSAELQESREVIDAYERIAAARAGDRIAFDALRQLAAGDGRTTHIAQQGVDDIKKTYEIRKRSTAGRDGPGHPPEGDSARPAEEDMLQVYADAESCEEALYRLAGLDQPKYTATFVRAVAQSKYLDCVYAGILCVENVSGKTFPALGIDEVLAWWADRQNDGQYHHGFEKVCEAVRQPNESEESFRWRQALSMKEWIDGEPGQYWCARHLFALLYSLKDEGSANRRIMMQQVLDYLATEEGPGNSWHVAKAMYLFVYNQLELNGFVNARLAEDPGFEDELRRLENEVFPSSFFQSGSIKWPSKSAGRRRGGLGGAPKGEG